VRELPMFVGLKGQFVDPVEDLLLRSGPCCVARFRHGGKDLFPGLLDASNIRRLMQKKNTSSIFVMRSTYEIRYCSLG